jgi:hypothetical protein
VPRFQRDESLRPYSLLSRPDQVNIAYINTCSSSGFNCLVYMNKESVGIATGWTSGLPVLAGARYFSVILGVFTGSGAHPSCYSMDTGSCSLG